MNKKVFIGGMVGGAVTLVFAFTLLFVLNGLFMDLVSLSNNVVVGFITLVLAPVSGGFLAGLIGRHDPRKAGLIAGLTASLFVFAAWLLVSGLSFQTILTGLAIIFVWVMLSRVGGGFNKTG